MDLKSIEKSKYRKMLLTQQAEAWDPDRDLQWQSLDGTRPLLPLTDSFRRSFALTDAEHLAASQFIGLMVAQAISQHEMVLAAIKPDCWDKPAVALNMQHDLKELGEEFFVQERKHSDAFARYVHEFAGQKKIDIAKLLKILPRYDHRSILTKLMTLNSRIGGRAAWWLVMLTEEESLSVYATLRHDRKKIEPLYYDLHRLHFEEEVRHMSYAPAMLRFLAAKSHSHLAKLIQQFDFIFMYVVHAMWVAQQMIRLRGIPDLSSASPFVTELKSAYLKLNRVPKWRMLMTIYREIPWFRHLLLPLRHQSIRSEVNRSGILGRYIASKIQTRIHNQLSFQEQSP